jgi:parallel beta-helix repeat protein
MRPLKSALFVIANILIVIFVRLSFLSSGMALELDGACREDKSRPREKSLFVSLEGNDAWTGQLASPNAARTDGPFATLSRARDEIRSIQHGKPLSRPITVYVRGGVYELDRPLVFLPLDSGTDKCPIIYTSYHGEKVVLSGGRAITGWKKVAQPPEVTRPELWTTEIPGVKEGEWYFHQLFAGGQRRQRARSPNAGFYHTDGEFRAGNPAIFKFHAGDVHEAWAAQGDVEVVGLEKWAEFRMSLKSVDTSTNTATLSTERQEFGDEKNARYWVENAADALDAPGEWFLDRRTGTLSYLALPGEDVTRVQFVAPFLTQLIRFEGNAGKGELVHDITLRSLTFAHADWALPPKGYADMQAAYDVHAAIELVAARQCRIEQSTFTHLGPYALEIHKGSQDDKIIGNEMTDLGAGGVKIGDPDVPKEEVEATTGIVVSENYIHDIGIVYPSAVGIWIGQSSANTVAHNEISDTYYTAISLGWTWGYDPTAARDNHIEFNSLYNIGRGLLSDMGCIYSLGVQPGTVERNNLCHDVSRFAYGGWGIYTDEGSSQILIENNIVYNTEDGGFHQHYGRENTVQNNIFAFGQEAQIRRTREESHRSFTFEHNIVYWKQGELLQGKWKDDQFQLDYNLYWPANGQTIQFGNEPLEEWRKRGQDAHSLVEDPLFADPDHGNFALKAGSPAVKIGFEPIDTSQMGRTK